MASVLTICSLCVFQYVSVVLPMNKSLTNLRCLVMVLCAWIISIFLATGPAIRNGGAINSLQTFSTLVYYHSTNRADISYNITMMLCGYLFPRVQRCMNTNRAWQWRHPSRQHRSQVLPFLWKRNCVWQCQFWFWHFWFVVLRFSSRLFFQRFRHHHPIFGAVVVLG